MQSRIGTLSFFLFNSCIGIFLTYGLFFSSVLTEFRLSTSSTSLIFGTFAILYSLSSLLMGLVMDRYGADNAILLGGLLMASGLLTSSLATSFQELVATYGVLAGLGTGSMWLTTSAVVFERFGESRIREVVGVISAGTAFGTLYFSPLEASLITSYGWRPAFLAVGGIVLVFTVMAYTGARGDRVKHPFGIRGALGRFNSARFRLLYLYYLFGNAFSRTITMIFVVPLLEMRGLGYLTGSLALTLIGIGSIFGRASTRLRWLSEERTAGLGFALQGITTVGLLFSGSLPLVSVFSLLFGIGYGAYIPQFALLTRKHYGIDNYGTVFGTLLTSFGVGAFIGPVFQGYQYAVTGNFEAGFYLAAAASMLVSLHLLVHDFRVKKPDNGVESHPV